MTRATRCLWAVVAVAGCAARPRVDRVTAPVAAVAPPAPMVLRFGVERPYDLRFQSDAEGPARSIVDGVRVESDASGARTARQTVLGVLIDAVELDGAWVFVSVDGVLARSDTFLGDLTLLGETCGRFRAHRKTRGRLAITCDDRMFVTDGRTLTPAGATPSRVVEVAFADARNGAAALVDGSLVATSDGGATWTPVALGDDLGVGVACVDRALRVRTARRTSTLSADGRLTTITSAARGDDPPLSARDHAPAPEEAVRAVRTGASRQAASREVRLGDGTSLRVEREAVLHLDADGRERSRSSLGTDVAVRPWGASAIVSGSRVYQTRDGEVFTLLTMPEELDRAFSIRDPILSNDGVHAAIDTPCPRGREAPTAERASVCVLMDDAGRWQDVAREAPRLALFAMHDGVLFFGSCAETGCETRAIDAESARSWTPSFAPDARDLRLETLLLPTRDGGVVGVACRGDCDRDAHRWLVQGELFTPLRVTPLPDATVRVRFFDRRRGIAIGDSMRALSRTLDGGQTWEHIEVPIDGEVARWPHAGTTRCDASGCVIDDTVVIEGWGPAQPPARRAFNVQVDRERAMARERERALAAREGDSNAPFAPTPLRCENVGAPVAAPWAGERDEGPDERTHVSLWRGGNLRVSVTDTLASLEWRGDAVPRGRASMALHDRYEGADVAVLGEGARGLLLDSQQRLVATWAAPHAPAIDLARALPNVRPYLRAGLTSVMPTSTGGAAVVTQAFVPRGYFTVALEIGADGALGASRVFAGWRRLTGVALLRGRGAYVTISERGAVQATPVAGGAPEELGALSSPLRVCADGATRGATPVRVVADYDPSGLIRLEGMTYSSSIQVDLAVSPAGACVSGVSLASNTSRMWLRASGGALRGATNDREHGQSIRCEVVR